MFLEIHRRIRSLCLLLLFFAAATPLAAQQTADPDFNARVDNPTFRDKRPRVVFDEAHRNYHTALGRYRPFANLIANDGCRVTSSNLPFTPAVLKGSDVLVIANASVEGPGSAFTDPECDAVRDWVHAGGSLLLITDHPPFASPAAGLAQRFGVHMSTLGTNDPKNHEPSVGPSCLVFSRENRLLGDHPIVTGRGPAERVGRVITFTGQSLKGPPDSVAFLRLADTAEDLDPANPAKNVSAAGRSQGLALKAGKGRVVVLGEAAVLSAQIVKRGQEAPFRMGMNFPGADNRQLGLNIMHWLCGVME